MNNMPMDNDALMQELRGEVERERWVRIWQQYRVPIIAVIALIILATGVHSYWKHATAQKNMALTEGLYDAIAPDSVAKPAEAAQKLADFAAEHPGTPMAFIAAMEAANLKLQANDVQGALQVLDPALATKDVNEDLMALATLFYTRLALETGDAAALKARLQPYFGMNNAYRFQAYETAALISYRAGDSDAAQNYLSKIVDDAAAPPSARQRAQSLQRVFK